MQEEKIEEIEARLNAVRVPPKELVLEMGSGNYFACPICDTGCPICEGEHAAPGVRWTYDKLACGIQVYGIGDDLIAMEAFAKNAPADIAYLLAEVKRLKQAAADLDMLNRRIIATSLTGFGALSNALSNWPAPEQTATYAHDKIVKIRELSEHTYKFREQLGLPEITLVRLANNE